MATRHQPTLGTPEAVRLTGYHESIDSIGVRQLLFGELVARAIGVVEHYLSDLYHDAMWIAANVDGPCRFHWAAPTWGTSIGTDRHPIQEALESSASSWVLWQVDLECRRAEWFATFTPVGRAGAV